MKMEALIDPTMISSCKLEPPDEDVKLSIDYSTHSSTTDAISEDGVIVKTELSENAFGLPSSTGTAIRENLVKSEMSSDTYCPSSGARMKVEEKIKAENLSKPDSQCAGVKLELEDIKVENSSKSSEPCIDVGVDPDDMKPDEMKMEALIDPTMISSCKLEPPDEDVKLSIDYSTHSSTTDVISEDGVIVKTELSENAFDLPSSTAIREKLVKSEIRTKVEEKIKAENLSKPDSQCADDISVKLELEDIKVENPSKSSEPCIDVGVDPDDMKPDEKFSFPLPVITLSQQPYHVDSGDQRNEMDCERSVPSSGSESKVMDGGVENTQDNMVDDDFETTFEGVHEEYPTEIDVDESLDNCLVSSDDRCGSKEEIKCRENKVHIRTHTGKKTHKCLICEKIFSYKSRLQNHIRTHTGEKPYKCLTCEKTFSQKYSLQAHIRIHTGENAHKCQTCGKIFPRNKYLQCHIRTHTGEKPYKCLTCEKTFSQIGHLQSHIRTHTGEKPHKCLTCEKTFSQKGSLQDHIRTHTGEKPYKCLTCEKTFSQKCHLQSHIRILTGEKLRKCHACEKTFSTRCSIQSHIRTHTGEKTHKCLTCERTFSQIGSLQSHIRTHTGEKPHKCHICEKTFSQTGHLQSHIITHTGEKPYKCLTCGMAFTRKSTLCRHRIRTRHIEERTTCM